MSQEVDEFADLANVGRRVGAIWTGERRVDRVIHCLADGRDLTAIAWGDGPPQLVMFHGGKQNAHTWDAVAMALGVPLLAIDLPGHGRSSWRRDGDYRPEHLAEDVHDMVRRLAPDASAVVGMSLGGLTSIVLAERHPDLVRRLIIVDMTPSAGGDSAREVNAFTRGPGTFSSLDAMIDHVVSHSPDGRDRRSLARGVRHNAAEAADGTWTWRWDPRRASYVGDGGQWFIHLWETFARTTQPTLLVRGGRSPVVADEHVEKMRELRPDVETVVIDGAGHSVQGSHPVELSRLIARFAALDSPTGAGQTAE